MSLSTEGLDAVIGITGVRSSSVGTEGGPPSWDDDTENGALELAVAALEAGSYEVADRVATMALVEEGSEPGLWMAAGLARLSRGRVRPARDAFKMCAWLSGDGIAREMVELLEGREI